MRRFNQLFLRSALFSACIAATVVIGSVSGPGDSFGVQEALAQDEPEMTFDEEEASDEEMTFDEAEDGEGEPEPEGDLEEPEPEPDEDPDGDPNAGTIDGAKLQAVSWQDIVVVVRKPFLKVSRIELQPSWGVTMNDNIIRHFQFSTALNYYLTDVLAVGLEAQYYVKDLREPFDLVVFMIVIGSA